MKTSRALALAAILGVSALLPVPARADTETCVGHTEYDNTEYGLSVDQIANRYDVYGVLIDDSDARFRRAYRTCWAPGERQVVVAYSYNDGGTVNWYVRDAP